MSRGRRIKEDEKNGRKKWIIILLFLLIIGIVVVLYLNKKNPQINIFSGIAGEEQSIDENADDGNKNYADRNIELPGYGTITIKANTTDIKSGINFYNPEKNDGYYYLKFQLKIGDEVLYESDLVSPGKHINRIKLTRALKAGTYDATVFMQPYQWDKKTPTNCGKIDIKLQVIN